jgi:FixJ family two-component response regulator
VSQPPLVLVADDDASVRRALSRLLRTAGFAVETYASAPALLARASPEPPVCVVSDVRMPGDSGLDLQARLRQTHPDIPVVFITGHGDVPTSVRAMKGGAVDFIEKPFTDEQLLDCVRRALETHRRRCAERTARQTLEQRVATLTPREREVLQLVVAGLLNKQIAGRLGTAEKTVKIHRGRVMEKMQAGSVAELVRMIERAGAPPLWAPPALA